VLRGHIYFTVQQDRKKDASEYSMMGVNLSISQQITHNVYQKSVTHNYNDVNDYVTVLWMECQFLDYDVKPYIHINCYDKNGFCKTIRTPFVLSATTTAISLCDGFLELGRDRDLSQKLC
jgi:hypothetical protein